MSTQHFIFMALAVWRVCNLICNEAGPFAMFERWKNFLKAHQKAHPASIITKFHAYDLFDCEYCLSVWVGGLTVITYQFFPTYVVWVSVALSLSTLTILIKYTKHLLQNAEQLLYIQARLITRQPKEKSNVQPKA